MSRSTPEAHTGTSHVATAHEEIAAPCDLVFDLLTDPSELGEWMRAPDGSATRDWELEPFPGGQWSATSVGRDGTRRRLHGEVVGIEAPEVLELTWNDSGVPDESSRVRFTLTPIDVDGEQWTHLTVTHTTPASTACAAVTQPASWQEALRAIAEHASHLTIVARW